MKAGLKVLVVITGLVLAVQAHCGPGAVPEHQSGNTWFTDARQRLQDRPGGTGQARNVILFVGDGMGVSTVTAARILAGQLQGKPGEGHNLGFDLFPYTALAKTYNVDAQTPDSAGTMTAMMTGVKTNTGVLGVDENVVRGDCDTVAGNELVTALELAELAGKSTGIVTTTRITHATPAAGYAHVADRNFEDISVVERAVSKGLAKESCLAQQDIAVQLVNFEANLRARYPAADAINGLEVAMGGGRRNFLPNDPAFNSPDARSAVEGDRTDGRDLVAEWLALYPEGVYIRDQAGFDALDTATHVLALFNESHMHYEADRHNDCAGEPSLTEMTLKAIDILDNNRRGYFLQVESGRIDHGHHAGNAHNALHDTIEFARAVQAAVDAVDLDDTLIIVTADHSHVFTMAGYPKRGNPILGKVVNTGSDTPALAADGMPYTTLGYMNGRGFLERGDSTDADAARVEPIGEGRVDLSVIDTREAGFHQEALVPLESETHGGEDVVIYAIGAGAQQVRGTLEQNVIFHIMDKAAGLQRLAGRALR